ncbi:GtrA family protein [Kocuria sp. JC486]|uniref:GtrA family protein n=1 Tax=Kocuria sp. JC486 TaxID=1970736 RepID=UPI001423E5F5|nr:GtrA family protein [Kocuria sp. JC486]NHU85340.1 GtrA family protein [Kocuria sp. JC486]
MINRFKAAWHLFVAELMKFGTVGGLAFVVNAGVVWILMHTVFQEEGHVKAKAIATVVATLFSWVANRYWTFRDKRQSDTKRELIQFLIANAIGMLIELACVGVSYYVLHLTSPTASFVSGTIVGTALGTIFRYFAYRFWVYAVELDDEPGFAPSAASELAAITGRLPVVKPKAGETMGARKAQEPEPDTSRAEDPSAS